MAKRNQLTSKDLPAKSKGRFNFDLDDNDFESYTRGYVPPNTANDTQKCVKLFAEWLSTRNAHFPENPVPENILRCHDKTEVCKWLCRFAAEVRKKDGEQYPPKTLHHYILGIQRHMRQTQKSSVNLLEDPEFLQLQNLLDALYRKLHAAGIGTTSKKTPVLTIDDENQLWASKVLDPDTPEGLLKAVFFLNGKNFCLRGGDEHRNLKLSQLVREVVKVEERHLVRYKYTEFVSKNHVGGLKQIRQENKVVHQYESEDLNRCHVLLLDKYISKLPPEAKAKDLFYMKPRSKIPVDPTAPWYTAVQLGKNMLAEMMKRISEEAKLPTKYTNHSLRAYGVTKLFKSDIPDKLIMERSGHRSIEGMRKYQRTDALQELKVCNALENTKEKSATNCIAPVQTPAVIAPVQTPAVIAPGSIPGFNGCTYNNCNFQFVIQAPIPPPQAPIPSIEDEFKDLDLTHFFDF